MPYVTLDDLVKRFGRNEILDIAGDETGDEIDVETVNRACEDAAGEIDSSLAAGGYKLPLTTVPPVVTAYACDIARYRMHDDRATEQVTKRYDDAIRFLRQVASGGLRLGAPKVDDEVTSAGEVNFVPGRRAFPGGVF
ncbi:gp436 family protein [Pseudomonas japonica]|uniref:gp436 family protein n=1 Tax=Pseudomonas japonica TaxID=256466 RepID=UPI003A853EAD